MKRQKRYKKDADIIMNIMILAVKIFLLPIVGIYVYTHKNTSKQQKKLGLSLTIGGVIIWLFILWVYLHI